MDFFTADLHFFHRRLAELRGFDNCVDKMNDTLVRNWNNKVARGDRVFILGDFSFGKLAETVAITSKLNGQLFLVRGNHDSMKECKANPHFSWVKDYEFMKAACGTYISMSHFPMLVWNKSHYGSWHLHGHSHGNLRLPPGMEKARTFDVGVDNVERLGGTLAPVTFEEIVSLRGEVGDVQLDHH